MLQAELGDGLASLLLVAGVDGDGRALGDHGLALLLGVAGLLLLDLDVLLLRLIGELFNAGVGHFCDVVIAVSQDSCSYFLCASRVGRVRKGTSPVCAQVK